jgi:hypothetical protein
MEPLAKREQRNPGTSTGESSLNGLRPESNNIPGKK